jgi:hypothetical protein
VDKLLAALPRAFEAVAGDGALREP